MSPIHYFVEHGYKINHRLGPATEVEKKGYKYVSCKKLDGDDYPIAIFRFKYRSRGSIVTPSPEIILTPSVIFLDALKSLLIIERSPSPEPEETPVPEQGLSLDNLNATQKTRLEQFLRELVVCVLIPTFVKHFTNNL